MNASRIFGAVIIASAICANASAVAALDTAKVSPRLKEIVKLVDSGVPEEVVLAYVQNSPVSKPNADEVIYLHEAGISKSVIMALISKNGGSTAAAAASAPAESGRVLARPTYSQPAATSPSAVYVEQPPVYVQPDPVVVYSAPAYYDYPYYYGYPYYRSYYSWPAISFGFNFGHYGFGHYGFGHHGLYSFGHGSFGHGFGGYSGGHSFGHGGLHYAGHSGRR